MNCELCGTNLAPDTTVCPVCGARVDGTAEPKPVRENVALGIVGALIGALLGGASILLFSKLGYVASLSGVLIAFATLLIQLFVRRFLGRLFRWSCRSD